MNDPWPWREVFEARLGSPLELRSLTLLQAAGLAPLKQFLIADLVSGCVFTVSDFAFPEQRLAVYVDGASIHTGEVLLRDGRVDERLSALQPPWAVVRLGRRDIDGKTRETAGRLRAAPR